MKIRDNRPPASSSSNQQGRGGGNAGYRGRGGRRNEAGGRFGRGGDNVAPTAVKQTGEERGKGRCYTCGETGHYSPSCPNKATQSNQGGGNSSNSNSVGRGAAFKPSAAPVDVEKGAEQEEWVFSDAEVKADLSVAGLVGRMFIRYIYLDSCATVNLLARRVFDRFTPATKLQYGTSIMKPNSKCSLDLVTSNQRLKPYAYCRHVPIRLGAPPYFSKKLILAPFYVINDMNYPVLIAFRCMCKIVRSIDFKKERVIMDDDRKATLIKFNNSRMGEGASYVDEEVTKALEKEKEMDRLMIFEDGVQILPNERFERMSREERLSSANELESDRLHSSSSTSSNFSESDSPRTNSSRSSSSSSVHPANEEGTSSATGTELSRGDARPVRGDENDDNMATPVLDAAQQMLKRRREELEQKESAPKKTKGPGKKGRSRGGRGKGNGSALSTDHTVAATTSSSSSSPSAPSSSNSSTSSRRTNQSRKTPNPSLTDRTTRAAAQAQSVPSGQVSSSSANDGLTLPTSVSSVEETRGDHQ